MNLLFQTGRGWRAGTVQGQGNGNLDPHFPDSVCITYVLNKLLLGKATPLQMLAVVFCELIFYSINEAIGVSHFEAVDMGGSMYVHTFVQMMISIVEQFD